MFLEHQISILEWFLKDHVTIKTGVIQFNCSIQVYLYSAFHDTNRCKAALQKVLSFYIIFRSRLLVVTMAEMYSKNHAVSYKLHVTEGEHY